MPLATDLSHKLFGIQSLFENLQRSHTARASMLLSALAALQFALFLGYFPLAIILTPYGDMLDWLNGYYSLADQNLWTYLWAPHNGHRILFTKLLTIGDAKLFGGLNYPVAWICLCAFLIAAAMALSGMRRRVNDAQTRRWVTAVAVLLLFPTSSYADFAYPVNSQHLLVGFFVFLACVLLARAGTDAGNKRLGRNTYFLLALGAAGCASLTLLNGLMVWPILVWISWALRLGWGYGFAIAALGILAVTGFSYQYPFSSEIEASVGGLGDIARIVKYLIEYHGMPWVEVGPLYWPAMVSGLAILSLSIFSLKGLFAPRMHQPAATIALAMLTFSLTTAVMIAVGRHQMDLMPAHRYSIFLLITFVSLFVLYIPAFERWMSSKRGHTRVMQATLAMALAYLGQQVMVGQFAAQRANAFAHYEKEMLAGELSPQAATALYFPSADVLKERYRLLEKQRIYMFRPPASK